MSLVLVFNDTATTAIYTLSLHDALPIWRGRMGAAGRGAVRGGAAGRAVVEVEDGEVEGGEIGRAHV